MTWSPVRREDTDKADIRTQRRQSSGETSPGCNRELSNYWLSIELKEVDGAVMTTGLEVHAEKA